MWAPTHRRLAGAVILIALGALSPPGAAAADDGSDRNKDVAAARQATAQFHAVQGALEAGFQADPYCAESPAGGMGYHYFNGEKFGSTDPRSPAVLLCAPDSGGGVRLAGVEYVVPDADQDLSTDGDRPSMFGVQFDGPMPGHFAGMPVHYDLHVWLWKHNPAGMFAEWNPGLSCS
ncbi:MAG: hypothetical protein H0U35_14500 [Sporichthyaceae bacterium]|nr:hypothetical protein [Sporichthyaceae bacterium]